MRLRVLLGTTSVGRLELVRGDLTTFRFDEQYLMLPERPVLGRWFEDNLSPDFVVKRSQSELPAFFQNYLPEPASALRELLARKAGVPAHREFQLLAALGDDLPGAVVVRPDVDAVTSDEQEQERIAAADSRPSGSLRFSLAGMQLKFSILQEADKLTLPVTGIGGRFIAKLPSRELPLLTQNEYFTTTWARRAGIRVPDTQLVPWRTIANIPEELDFEETDAFLVERYDRPRTGGARIHQEDFAQILNKRTVEKYGDESRVTFDRMGKIIVALCGEEDFYEFVRRLVFIILSGNPDAHLKNWSFIYADGRKPKLAPAYDLVSATPYSRFPMELACKLAKENRMSEIRKWHFGRLAQHADVDHERVVRFVEETSEQVRRSFDLLETDFSPGYRQAVAAHLARMRID